MPAYVTTSEVSDFTGAPNDTTLSAIIDGVESLFNGLIGSETGLLTSIKTEQHEMNTNRGNGRIFYLKTLKPTAITTINGISPGTINVNYTIVGQKLENELAVTTPTAFPYRYTVVYASGFASISTIPADIKLIIKMLAGAVVNTRKTEGIASFKQDLLSVNYKDTSILDLLSPENRNAVNLVVNRYRVFNVI